jgi:hypothetical protein
MTHLESLSIDLSVVPTCIPPAVRSVSSSNFISPRSIHRYLLQNQFCIKLCRWPSKPSRGSQDCRQRRPTFYNKPRQSHLSSQKTVKAYHSIWNGFQQITTSEPHIPVLRMQTSLHLGESHPYSCALSNAFYLTSCIRNARPAIAYLHDR